MRVPKSPIVIIFALIAVIANYSEVSFGQSKRPTRKEAEEARAKKLEEEKRILKDRQDAFAAGRRFFESLFLQGCDQGEWATKGVTNRTEERDYSGRVLSVQRSVYWFRQYKGVNGLDLSHVQLLEPDGVMKLNHPDVANIVKFRLEAEFSRAYIFEKRWNSGREIVDYSRGAWTDWERHGSILSYTLWKRNGVWEVKESELGYDAASNFSGSSVGKFVRPTCEEVKAGKPVEIATVEKEAAERRAAVKQTRERETASARSNAESTINDAARRLIDARYPQCNGSRYGKLSNQRLDGNGQFCFLRFGSFHYSVKSQASGGNSQTLGATSNVSIYAKVDVVASDGTAYCWQRTVFANRDSRDTYIATRPVTEIYRKTLDMKYDTYKGAWTSDMKSEWEGPSCRDVLSFVK